MIIIPAIDIKEGRCVRLRQGRMEDETIFSEDPVEVAERWIEAGAKRLHIVDLDGAVSGAPRNFDIIQSITSNHPDIPVQVGGGIRDEDIVLLSVGLYLTSKQLIIAIIITNRR